MKVTARVDGLTEIDYKLRDLPGAFRRLAAEAIETGAAIMESEAKGRVPVDSGDLMNSIGTNIREDGLQAAVGSGLFYAAWVEVGTSDTPAQPYLYPAFLTGAKFVRRHMKGWVVRAARSKAARAAAGR